ncbi:MULTISPECIES: aspartate/glutamate racemase family protein [unclassified Thermotoga]|uniref:aspartate/glutamate racemase family protein n=1 Tax=unclassified Thermotoga TaxID=2631113 RepID=UPI000280E742|nr:MULTISPECIES: aspartate/glutamate racemase family protein [unclassified Thermotoga]AIY87261.1 Asp/Glu/hydantoin racemase [Thermotoga sp. 2812B]EJX26377.1 Asp/Glu/hydantoin racemase [Thermotoga sp. EMP]
MAIVGFVHTSVIVYPIIQRYVNEIIPDVEILHIGDDSMERDNSRSYPSEPPSHNYLKFILYARFLEKAGADVVVLTCSTLNRAVEFAQPLFKIPLLQIDRPMMELAVENARKRVGLIATLETTIQPSLRLLKQVAKEKQKEIEVKISVCNGAFRALKNGDTEKHNKLILEEIKKIAPEVDVICLAQLSMSIVEPYLNDMNLRIPVYNSARTGIMKVKEILEHKED